MPSFRKLIAQLEPVNSFSRFNIPEGYSIVPQVHPTWKSSERRFLFVLESMDSVDIKHGAMFSSMLIKNQEVNVMRATFRNVLQAAWDLYQEYRKTPTDFMPSMAVVNFNASKFYHTSGTERHNAEAACAKRLVDIINVLKPTDVVVLGDAATSNLIGGQVQNLPYKRGWVHDVTIGNIPVRLTHTLDLESLYNPSGSDVDDEDAGFDDASGAADLLYFVARNLMNAFAGKHLHSLRHIVPRPILVDTIPKFDKLFQRLVDEPEWAFDSETENLESYHNKFYTMQFAFEDTKGYILPISHPKTPFSEEEQDYIKKKLTKLFGSEKKIKTIITMNGGFDFRVVRAQFNIPIIHHTVWEVTAGESLLDENVGLFNRFKFDVGNGVRVKHPMGNLKALFCHYENDFYFTAPFSKEQRSTIGAVDIMTHVPCQEYCVMDCQSLIGIKKEQLARASKIRLSETRTYEKIYYRHVSVQMSHTVMATSHMYQHGSHVDMDYLRYLMSKESPLLKVIKSVDKELLGMPTVQEANAQIMKDRGMQSKGLFGNSQSVFEPNKPDHKHLLFYQVMKLKPVSETDSGKPAIDKTFFKVYAEKFKEVKLYDERNKAAKLLGTYVKGWYNKITDILDSALDHCIRPSFGFFDVVTGRLNSFKPSLQQVPSRGPSAKYIKRMFTAEKGCLNLRWDFSAQEVRFWGIMANDPAVAASFKAGQELRQQFITAVGEALEAIKAELKTKGDVHVQNVFRFFGKWIEKSDPLRDAIKAVIFGVLYGKAAQALSKDIAPKDGAREALLKEIAELEKAIKEYA